MNELNKKMLTFAGFKLADIKKHYYWEIGGFRVDEKPALAFCKAVEKLMEVSCE